MYRYDRFIKNTILILLISLSNEANAVELVLNSPMENRIQKNNQIVIIGASYAKSWHPDSIAGSIVVNKGVGGQETSHILARFEKDVISLSPKAVIIWGFINDIFRSDPDTVDEKLENTQKNIETMIKMTKDAGIKVILATEVTITTKDEWGEKVMSFIGRLLGKESYQDYVNALVIKTNHWLRKMASEQAIPVLDFEQCLIGKNGLRKRKYAVEDGSHLTSLAYEKLMDCTNQANITI